MVELAMPPFRALANMACLAVLCSAQTSNQVRLVVQTGRCFATSLAFSHDGKFLLTGCEDHARLWDVATRRQILRFNYPEAAVQAVGMSPDGQTMFVATATNVGANAVRFLEVSTGREVRKIEARFHRAALSGNWRVLLTGGLDAANPARLWDVESGKELQRFPARAPSTSVAISSDGRLALTAGTDAVVRLWDTSTGKQVWQFREHESKSHVYTGEDFFNPSSKGVLAMAFSPDGLRALTGSADGSVRLWDIPARRELQHLRPQSLVTEPAIHGVEFSPDGHLALLTFEDVAVTVELWDLTLARALARWQPLTEYAPAGLPKMIGIIHALLSPDGHTVAIGGLYRPTLLWDAATGKEIGRFDGHSDESVQLAFSLDGHLALVVDRFAAQVWDIAAGRAVCRVAGQFGTSILSPDGRALAAESAVTGAWSLWDVSSGRQIAHLPDKSGDSDFRTASVAFSSDGRLVLAGCSRCYDSKYSALHSALVWDVVEGREVRRLKLDSFMGRLAPSFDGHSALSTGGRVITLWDITTGSVVQRFESPEFVSNLALSPDARFAVTSSPSHVTRVWDLATGRERQRIQGGSERADLSFSPDGGQVVTSSRGVAQVWDVASGKELRTLAQPDVYVTISPTGNFGLSIAAGNDGAVRFWNVQTGQQVATLVSFDEGSWAVVDPDGRFDTNNLDGRAPLHWILDSDPMRPLPLEIFMRDYYTPRVLTRILSGEELPPLPNIAELNRVQPKVEVLAVGALSESPDRVTVTVKVSNVEEKGKRSGAQDLRVFRNGQLVAFQEGPLAQDQNGEATLTFPNIQLAHNASDTSNKSIFTAYAFNVDRVKSQTVELAYQPARPLEPRPKNAFIISIGVNKTPYAFWNLEFAAADARKVAAALEQRLRTTFSKVKVYSLISDEAQPNGAAKQTIRQRLAEIAAAATPDDALFMSFSGHGYADLNGRFYLFPSDLKSGGEQRATPELLSSAISSDELAEWLRPLDAGEMTIIIDACHSAASVEGEGFKPGPMGSRGLGQLAYDKRIRILAATQVANAALEQGLLTYALVHDGLEQEQADWQPKDKRITIAEWLKFAVNRVPQLYDEIRTGRRRDALFTPDSKPKSASPLQLPALFDFTHDNVGLVLQQIQ